MHHFKYPALIALLILSFNSACTRSKPAFQKEPIDNLIRDYASAKQYSINLYDMDYREKEDKYFHKYRILHTNNPEDTLKEKTTDWLPVSPIYFEKHTEHMGMTLVSKANGKVEKKVTPPGYDQYVGNEKYGHWQQGSGGNSFWAFYGQYAFMSSMLNMGGRSIYRNDYNNYRRNYAPYGRTYYGGTGSNRRYGTGGSYVNNTGNRSWVKKGTGFRQSVRSRASRSASRMKRSRNTSRFRSSSRSRSRGGGFGK